MKACKVDECQLGLWIDGSTGTIRYLGPAITEKLARKIIEAERRTRMRSHVVIDLDADIDRSGYGDTAGVRILYEEGINVQKRAGLRVAAFSADRLGVVWSPIAERIDEVGQVMVNGIMMEGDELEELRRWTERMMGIEPQRPENTNKRTRERIEAEQPFG